MKVALYFFIAVHFRRLCATVQARNQAEPMLLRCLLRFSDVHKAFVFSCQVSHVCFDSGFQSLQYSCIMFLTIKLRTICNYIFCLPQFTYCLRTDVVVLYKDKHHDSFLFYMTQFHSFISLFMTINHISPKSHSYKKLMHYSWWYLLFLYLIYANFMLCTNDSYH